MLVKNEKTITRYILPCKIVKNGKDIYFNRYYANEFALFKAYRQLKAINGSIIPLYPVIDDISYANV